MTTPPATVTVIGGVDTHKHTHYAAAIDDQGRLLGHQEFPATDRGYAALLAWMRAHGHVRGDRCREHRLLRRHADPGAHRGRRASRRGQPAQPARPAHGRQVRPPRRRADRSRRAGPDLDRHPEGQVRRRRGDPHPARHPRQRGQGPHPGLQHAVGRHDRRSIAAARRAGRADQADPGQPMPAAAPRDRRPAHARATTRTGCSWPASRPPCATSPAAGRRSTTEIKTLNRQIEALVRLAAPELVELLRRRRRIAGQFLVTAGDNPDRIRSEAAFAKLCGVAPQPASSGRTTGRHRLSRGGDRAANSALYIVTIVRMRHHAAHPRLRRTTHRRRPQQTRDHPLPHWGTIDDAAG